MPLTKDAIIIDDLSGGRNGRDSPWHLPDDQAAEVANIDLQASGCGCKRAGASAVTVAFSSGGPFSGSIGSLLRHIPGDNEGAAELWAIDGNSVSRFARMAGATTFADVTLKDNLASAADAFNVFGASMPNGFFFLAYKSGQNRTYVWDPTLSKVRRVGLATPAAAPTGATDGGAGLTFSRVYRVRWVDVSGSDVRRISEASATLSMSITDDAGYTVTRPTAASEDETHWDLEAANTTAGPFYRIARTAIATTTFDDTNATIPTTNPSPADGINFPPPGAKFVLATDARLIWAGHYGVTGGYVTGKTSRIWFSPVLGDNDIGDWERIPTGRYLDVDASITALAGPLNGVVYVFSFRRIWKLVPTGDATAPYVKFSVSHSIGCIRQQSIVYGEDEQGNPCIYFLSHLGPYRIGIAGLQFLGTDIDDLWLNYSPQNASNASHGIYHASRREVWWWLASGSTAPQARVRFDVTEGRPTNATTVRRGWTYDDGDSCVAYASVMFSNTLAASMSSDLKPYIAQAAGTGRLWKCDDTTVVTDAGGNYSAYVNGKIFLIAGLTKHVLLDYPIVVLIGTNVVASGQIQVRAREQGATYGSSITLQDVTQVIPFSMAADQMTYKVDGVSLAGVNAVQIQWGNSRNGTSDPDKWFGVEVVRVPFRLQEAL